MSEYEAIVKIIAQHTREYSELDLLYKRLGVKHLTLLEVHKKTIGKMAALESEHHDLQVEHTITKERAATIRLLYNQLKGENKKLKVLFEAQRVEIVEDLKQITWLIGKAPVDMGFYIKKWEAKK